MRWGYAGNLTQICCSAVHPAASTPPRRATCILFSLSIKDKIYMYMQIDHYSFNWLSMQLHAFEITFTFGSTCIHVYSILLLCPEAILIEILSICPFSLNLMKYFQLRWGTKCRILRLLPYTDPVATLGHLCLSNTSCFLYRNGRWCQNVIPGPISRINHASAGATRWPSLLPYLFIVYCIASIYIQEWRTMSECRIRTS